MDLCQRFPPGNEGSAWILGQEKRSESPFSAFGSPDRFGGEIRGRVAVPQQPWRPWRPVAAVAASGGSRGGRRGEMSLFDWLWTWTGLAPCFQFPVNGRPLISPQFTNGRPLIAHRFRHSPPGQPHPPRLSPTAVAQRPPWIDTLRLWLLSRAASAARLKTQGCRWSCERRPSISSVAKHWANLKATWHILRK